MSPDDPYPVLPGPPGALTRRQRRERTLRALHSRTQISGERRRQQLLEYVVSINMGVVTAVVARYAHRGLESEELLLVARAALIRAARDFDPCGQGEFAPQAVATIRRELEKHLYDHGRHSPNR